MKKYTLIWLILCLLSVHLNAKPLLPADHIKAESIKQANADIKKGKPKFLIQGGIVSTRIKGQELFEQKYGVVYQDLGCVGPSAIRIEDYNKVVASFMDKKYGKAWRKEVRKDVQGI
ncbi:hypothetical protein SAMN04488511_11312 [Pedobacter suwonensis]|uniref:Uncharacterized protein n=1 Tax=Pedobacter suwonensis TaxID=332999 RepID=A0A1I0TQM0_9SPHI|nr:hypothetical protein [Pedobacter suwonensis]SFA54091.1 hypothetical protein SAMN04488511_11312 [Pedobacter suwonensis]